jgi:hypothetical protein
MQQNSKKMENNPKKLMTVVVVLSLFVFALFGLAPSA